MSDQFRRDLQAWTEARVRAMLRRQIRVRTRGQPLIDDLNALLTDRIALALEYLRGKALPGEFLTSTSRIVPTEPLPPIPLIDHGWATGDYTDTVIYTWPSLATTLSSLGFVIGASGEYDSVVPRGSGQTELYPEEFSGLTRLFVQALLGSGRDQSELVPDGWELDFAPGRLGCIRSPGGVYWLVRLREMLGVEVSRLVVPAEYAQLAADLNAGVYSGQNAMLVEAAVLSVLELPSTQDTVLLLEAGMIGRFPKEWTAIYFDGFTDCPWSWCFRYQKRGETDEDVCGAVCVLHRSTDTAPPQRVVQWREAQLTIVFDGSGRPSATAAVTEAGWMQPVKDNIYTLKRYVAFGGATQNYLQLYFGDTEEMTIVDTSSPLSEWGVIASCYGPDGTIHRLELIGRNKIISSSSGNAPGMPDNYTICKSDSYQVNETIGTAVMLFAGNTIDDLSERGTIRATSGTWEIDCPDATGSGSEQIIYSGSSIIEAVICGPGMVLLIGEVVPRIKNSSWGLSAGDGDFSCFCNGEPYELTSAMAWNEARTGGDYTETLNEDEAQNGLVVLNHDTRTTVSDTHAAYTWITDILADADPDPEIPVVVGYDSLAQSYGGQINIAGEIYPDGLNATGAELDGKFCGGV